MSDYQGIFQTRDGEKWVDYCRETIAAPNMADARISALAMLRMLKSRLGSSDWIGERTVSLALRCRIEDWTAARSATEVVELEDTRPEQFTVTGPASDQFGRFTVSNGPIVLRYTTAGEPLVRETNIKRDAPTLRSIVEHFDAVVLKLAETES